MYPASNSSSTRPSHSLPPGATPTLSAAPRTTTYGAGCPKICLRMCFNIPQAFSLILRTLSSTTVSVRAPQTLPYPVVRLRPCYQRREVAGCVPGYVRRVLRSHLRLAQSPWHWQKQPSYLARTRISRLVLVLRLPNRRGC